VALPRTLGARDLLLLELVAIVNVSLLPPVAALGRVALALWAAAFVLFFVPELIAVLVFARRAPGEGGIYLWTRQQFGDTHGFVAGWCYWTNNLFYIPMQLIYVAGALAYAGGAASAHLVDEKWFVASVAYGWLLATTLANIRGLAVGKWVQNVGGIGTACTVGLIVAAGAFASRQGGAVEVPWTAVGSTELFAGLSVMCFAFYGLELASTMGDEMRNPARDLPRALVAAGLLTFVAYVAVTWALQALVPTDQIATIQGIVQAVDAGAQRAGVGWMVAPVALALAVSIAGGASAWFAGSTRVPFMAGFDHALPAALGAVHPRWGSPHVALAMHGVLSASLITITFVGSTVAEAYQVLLKSAVVLSLVPFAYMFAALARLRDARWWQRAAGAMGFAVTLLGIVAAFVPTSDVDRVLIFQGKLFAGVAGPIGIGLVLFARVRKSVARSYALPAPDFGRDSA
jgi:amino acid transporter